MALSVLSGITSGITNILPSRMLRIPAAFLAGFLAILWLSGCATSPGANAGQPEQSQPVASQPHQEALSLKEGDVLKIAFPSVPSMDTTQPVRQDGRITLPIIGEFI